MGRTILAVIVGYIVMLVAVIAFSMGVWFALGAEFAYADNTWMASLPWTLIALATGFVAAVIGGVVAGKIGQRPVAVRGLMFVTLLLGIVLALPAIMDDSEVAVREPGPITATDAMQNSKSPTWYHFVIPLVGAVGVLVGGSLALGTRVKPGGL